MSTHTPARVPGGAPDGGQFATTAKTEVDVTLAPGAAGLDDITPAEKARYTHIESRTKDVAAALGAGKVWDEGGGTTIFFDARSEEAPEADYAYCIEPEHAADPSQGGKWGFHRGDAGTPLSNGDWSQDVTSDLTLDSDPAAVADWIKGQMQHFGTPGAPA